MKKLAFILTLLLVVGLQSAQAQRGLKSVTIKNAELQDVLLYHESHALVIGASDYTAGWPKLPGVLNDVQAVKTALEDQGFNVVTVVDPTRERLYKSFDEFVNTYGQDAENRILIYFAGHGHTQQLKWGGDMGYIIPVDAPNPNHDNEEFLEKAMDMQMIEVYAKRIQAKHVLFLFDACFSGAIFDLTRARPQHITSKTALPVRQFITSGSAEEEVPDRSVFRSQFVEALNGEGDVDRDGYITGAELGEFLQKTVVNYSKGCQHPQYGKIRNPKLDKGDFVFDLAAVAPPPPPAPKRTEFSLDDLNQATTSDEQTKSKWTEYLRKMTSAYKEVLQYESRNSESALKATAWERFRSSFTENDPYTNEDETMRADASERIRKYQTAQPAVRPPVVTSIPSAGGGKQSGSLPGLVMVRIQGGSFQMGSPNNENGRYNSEGPVRQVYVKSFYMMTTEVTQEMWQSVMGHNPSNFKGANLPVEQVTWSDCQEFIRKLNQRDPGKGYRLPSEAEWEYACRAGTRTRFYSGDNDSNLGRVAWTSGNSGGKTHPVGEKQPNAWGLYDLHGNVWEWCEDWYHSNYRRAPVNGSAWTSPAGQERVLRGGAWSSFPRYCRSAFRSDFIPGSKYGSVGFRLVATF